MDVLKHFLAARGYQQVPQGYVVVPAKACPEMSLAFNRARKLGLDAVETSQLMLSAQINPEQQRAMTCAALGLQAEKTN